MSEGTLEQFKMPLYERIRIDRLINLIEQGLVPYSTNPQQAGFSPLI